MDTVDELQGILDKDAFSCRSLALSHIAVRHRSYGNSGPGQKEAIACTEAGLIKLVVDTYYSVYSLDTITSGHK